MKRIRTALAATFVGLSLLVGFSAPVFATAFDLQCLVPETPDNPQPQPTSLDCDLNLDTQVSVNGGAFVDDTAGTPVSANIGDTITFKITVTNTSLDDKVPSGLVTVNNVLPSGVSFVSGVASAGAYENGSNTWNLMAENDLPATLTLTTKAVASGLASDTATMTAYTSDLCDTPDGFCTDPPFVDANSANNSHVVYVLINGKLVAVSTPKAPNTGFGVAHLNVTERVIAYGALVSGLLATTYGLRRSARKTN